jgi:hypothetical protein
MEMSGLMRRAYIILLGKSEWKKPFVKCKDGSKVDFK